MLYFVINLLGFQRFYLIKALILSDIPVELTDGNGRYPLSQQSASVHNRITPDVARKNLWCRKRGASRRGETGSNDVIVRNE